MAEAGQQTVREAVGVVHARGSFQDAIEDLMSAASLAPNWRDPADTPLTGVELDPFLLDARILQSEQAPAGSAPPGNLAEASGGLPGTLAANWTASFWGIRARFGTRALPPPVWRCARAE